MSSKESAHAKKETEDLETRPERKDTKLDLTHLHFVF